MGTARQDELKKGDKWDDTIWNSTEQFKISDPDVASRSVLVRVKPTFPAVLD